MIWDYSTNSFLDHNLIKLITSLPRNNIQVYPTRFIWKKKSKKYMAYFTSVCHNLDGKNYIMRREVHFSTRRNIFLSRKWSLFRNKTKVWECPYRSFTASCTPWKMGAFTCFCKRKGYIFLFLTASDDMTQKNNHGYYWRVLFTKKF